MHNTTNTTNTVSLHYRFTETVQTYWGTMCCWGTTLIDGALTTGAGARVPPAQHSLQASVYVGLLLYACISEEEEGGEWLTPLLGGLIQAGRRYIIGSGITCRQM